MIICKPDVSFISTKYVIAIVFHILYLILKEIRIFNVLVFFVKLAILYKFVMSLFSQNTHSVTSVF